jgi:hypothetical protein
MKAVKANLVATNPERVPIFEKNAATFAKKFVLSYHFPVVPHSSSITITEYSPTLVITNSTPESP